MAYNPVYPATYQPYYNAYNPYQPVQQNVTPTQQQNNGIIWVSGEAGAKAYLVAPNTTVQLWDSEAQVIYLKSADASGMPSIKVLDYTIRNSAQNGSNSGVSVQPNNLPDYATKDEIKAITGELATLKSKVESLTKKRKERDEDDD